jgi:hypothetical protein
VETKTYTRQELGEFIHSSLFTELTNIPISKHRAISQINNPRADENDILLVAQYDGKKLLGYLGILPDYLFPENKTEKVGWLTCFWVAEEYKSKNVAANLFLRVIRAWDQKILITNIVPALEPVYQKTKIFQPTIYKSGFRGYVRLNLNELLPPKHRLFRKMVPVLKLADSIINLPIDLKLKMFPKFDTGDLQLQYLQKLSEDDEKFMARNRDHNWNQRGMTELNWIISNPWIIQSTKDQESRRYYFSSVSRQFSYRVVRIQNRRNETIALAVLLVRNKNLSTPYIFCNDLGWEPLAKTIVNMLIELKLNMFTTFNQKLTETLNSKRTPFLFSKTIKKPYLISKKFEYIKELHFQDGDGDCAFY